MDGPMTICHDAGKGRYIGSHWPNHVAPLLYSTGLLGLPTKPSQLAHKLAYCSTSWPIAVQRFAESSFSPRSSASLR